MHPSTVMHGINEDVMQRNGYCIRQTQRMLLISPLPHSAMHYPQLVSTTTMGAVLGDWPGDSAPLQPCQHVLDELPYPLVIRMSHGLECGSHAAAPAVLTIRRVVHRYPSWSRGCWMCAFRSSSRSGMNELPARRRVVAPGSCLYTNGHDQPLPAVAMMPARGLDARATGSCHRDRWQSSLTQRDM